MSICPHKKDGKCTRSNNDECTDAHEKRCLAHQARWMMSEGLDP